MHIKNTFLSIADKKFVRQHASTTTPISPKPVAERVREYIRKAEGEFSLDKIMSELVRDGQPEDLDKLRGNVRKCLRRELKKGLILNVGDGYRRVGSEGESFITPAEATDREARRRVALRQKNRMNFSEVTGEPADMRWALGLEKSVSLPPGSLVVISGATDTGKTTFSMWLPPHNWDRFSIVFFNSEMHPEELADRMRDFERHLDLPAGTYQRKVDWQKIDGNALDDRAMADLADSIEPDGLNVIDYLEINDKFYRIGEVLNKLHARIQRGVLVVFLQKNPEKEMGHGGVFNLSRARLAITLDQDEESELFVLRFQKVKKPVVQGSNPKKTEILYELNENATELIFKGTRPRQLKKTELKPAGSGKAKKSGRGK